jgi:hypothetical protein
MTRSSSKGTSRTRSRIAAIEKKASNAKASIAKALKELGIHGCTLVRRVVRHDQTRPARPIQWGEAEGGESGRHDQQSDSRTAFRKPSAIQWNNSVD